MCHVFSLCLGGGKGFAECGLGGYLCGGERRAAGPYEGLCVEKT